jgi:hypothetical protein
LDGNEVRADTLVTPPTSLLDQLDDKPANFIADRTDGIERQSASWLKNAFAICERPALCVQAKRTSCAVMNTPGLRDQVWASNAGD